MEQNELRAMYNKRLEREKQCYISKQVQIDSSLLSRFKTGKIDLYPHLFKLIVPFSIIPPSNTSSQPTGIVIVLHLNQKHNE